MGAWTLRRLCLALLAASLLALGIGAVNADGSPVLRDATTTSAPVSQEQDPYEGCDQDDPNSTCFYTYNAGMCAYLTPYTYWWGFWGCETRMEMSVDEDVTITPADSFNVIEIRRVLSDGSVVQIVRIVPRRKGR